MSHRRRKRKRTVVVGRKPVAIAAGETKTVKITLNARGRRLLARFGKLPVKLTVMLTGDHTTTVATKKLTIKKPHHPRRHRH